MRKNRKEKANLKPGKDGKCVTNASGLFEEQPEAYRKVEKEEGDTYKELRNLTEVFRNNSFRF